ncbi:MAG: hypothetical protein ABI598_03400 [Chloroflexota bacterium]
MIRPENENANSAEGAPYEAVPVPPEAMADPALGAVAAEAGALEPEHVPALSDDGPDDGSPAKGSADRRRRWLIAGAISIVVALGAVAAAFVLGARPLPEAYRYLPADSAFVIEVRPELPGDQRANLGSFLAPFPGFADQSRLTDKLDEAFDRLVRAASAGDVDYATQVKPLLAGPLVAGVPADALGSMAGGDGSARGLVVATTSDGTTCETIFGATTSLESHRGVSIQGIGDMGACAIDARFLLVGDVASVKAGLDAQRDHSGLDTRTSFTSTRARLDSNQLVIGYVDGSALGDLAGTLGTTLGIGSTADGTMPAWLVAGLRVDGDALILDVQTEGHPAADLGSGVPTEAPASESAFASILPSNTVGLAEVHGAGASLQRLIAQLQAQPSGALGGDQLQAALGVLSGTSGLTTGIEDVGVAVFAGDAPGGAILVRSKDELTATAQYTQIRNLLALASVGTDITLRDTDHGGVQITTVDLGNLGTLIGGLGLPTDVPVGDASASFSMAVDGTILIVGLGDGTVERILDVSAGSGLAASPVYRRLMELTGSSGNLQGFVAVDAVLGLIEQGALTDTDLEAYRRDMKPYLDHLAGAGVTSTDSSTGGRIRLVIVVK